MRQWQKLLVCALGACSVGAAWLGGGSVAHAADPVEAAADADIDKSVPARFIMGIKFGGGGTLWDSPDESVLSATPTDDKWDIPLFNETRAGYTISSGFYIEGLFFDHLGLEVGFNFVQHNLLEEVKWSFTEQITVGGDTTISTFHAKSEEKLSWTAFHLPILVKAVVPTSSTTRISLGVGPEFAFTSWARGTFKVTESTNPDGTSNTNPDGTLKLPASRGQLQRLGAKLEDSVYLKVVLGIQITAGDFLIPIDIHWGYNFSQEKKYLERAIVDPNTIPDMDNPDRHPAEVTLKTRDTMYGGINVGIGYQF